MSAFCNYFNYEYKYKLLHSHQKNHENFWPPGA